MTAFFFGETERQLFGYYHTAAAGGTAAAVLCPSWGPEYQYAHRAFRVLGRRLAERGTHVLRFDYAGTGDSWGDASEIYADQWVQDVVVAVDEIKAMTGATRVDLVGLRYGAHVAARASTARGDVRRVVLWDPILDGERWLSELADTPAAAKRARQNGGTTLEFSHRVVSPALLDHFRTITPDAYVAGPDTEQFVLSTRGKGEMDPLPRLHSAEYREVVDSAPWVEDTSIWSGLVPADAIAAITEWVTS